MFSNTSISFQQAFETCLERVQSEEMSIEDVSSFFPPFQNQLISELKAAHWLASQPVTSELRPGFLHASRKRLIERLETSRVRQSLWVRMKKFSQRRGTIQFAMAMLILVAVLTGNTVALASEQAIPGDPVYPVKLTLERVRLSTSFNPDQSASLKILYSQQRMSELEAVILEERYEYIPKAASAFQVQIGETLQSLDRLSQTRGQGARDLANTLDQTLGVQTQTLSVLATMVPVTERAQVVAALDVSSRGTQEIRDLIQP